MEIKYYTQKEFEETFYDFSTYSWKIKMFQADSCSSPVFENFRYFAPPVGFNDNYYFYLAFDEGEIVGVLAYGFFDNYGDSPLYCGVRYVDTHISHRRKGIATKLVQALCENMQEVPDIKVSQMSDEGKQCNMLELFQRYSAGKNIIYDVY